MKNLYKQGVFTYSESIIYQKKTAKWFTYTIYSIRKDIVSEISDDLKTLKIRSPLSIMVHMNAYVHITQSRVTFPCQNCQEILNTPLCLRFVLTMMYSYYMGENLGSFNNPCTSHSIILIKYLACLSNACGDRTNLLNTTLFYVQKDQ